MKLTKNQINDLLKSIDNLDKIHNNLEWISIIIGILCIINFFSFIILFYIMLRWYYKRKEK